MDTSIPTLLYFFSVGYFIITLFFLSYIRIYKVKDPNLKIFIWSLVLLIIACPLFALRNRIPGLFSIVFANLFLIFGISYSVYCIAFSDKPFNRKRFLLINIIPTVLFIIFLPFMSYFGGSSMFLAGSLILGSIYLIGGTYLVSAKSKSKIQRLTAYFYLIITALWAIRAYWIGFFDPNSTILTSSTIHVIVYLFWFIISFSSSIILLLILKEQDFKNQSLSEERFRAYTNQASEGITVADLEGNYIFVNPAFCMMSGYTEKELLNMNVFELSSKKQELNIFNLSKGSGQGKPIKIYLQKKDKSDFLTEITGKLITVDDKQLVLGTIRDITIRQKALDALKKSESQLKEANATKDKFFSILAHDLINPFNIILGYSDLLVSDYDSIEDDKKREYIRTIHSATNSTFSLLENLLSWARVQQNRIVINKEELYLSELIDENINLYSPNAQNKNILISNEVSDKQFINVDKLTFSTVLANLISNAIKFSPENGKINITAHSTNKTIDVKIQDNGVGMSEEVIAKLFKVDQFHSTAGTLKEKGTGLGLILCKEFMEKNGGQIKVESEVGKGSIFTISLPI